MFDYLLIRQFLIPINILRLLQTADALYKKAASAVELSMQL